MNTVADNERLVLLPQDEQEWLKMRTEDITSTDCAALFGISPYMTPFELWHRKKKGDVVKFEGDTRMNWGQRLQDAIAAGIAEDNGWTIRKMTEYIRIPARRLGSSFDFEIQKNALLEIKNVDSLIYKDGWFVDADNVEAPAHIELQIQHEMLVADRDLAYIGALVGGNRLVLIKRERDPHVVSAIENRVQMFWDSIDNNIEPEPDFKRDAGFIASLYRYADPSKVYDAGNDTMMAMLVKNYKAAAETIKTLQNEKDGYKARMLTIIGDAAKVVGQGYSISAGLVGPTHIEYDREGYRDFRVNLKKSKETK